MKPVRLKSVLMQLVVTLAILFILAGGAFYYLLSMPGANPVGNIPALTDSQQLLRDRLRSHVEYLAGTIGERNTEHPGTLARTVEYLDARFREAGLVPHRLEYDAAQGPFVNLEAEIYGVTRPQEIIVIGAHYDSAWPAPGADDNASGVAALLELARYYADRRFDRTVRLVAFPNEESPHYGTDRMGSKVYARQANERGDNIIAMYSLEMLGYYDTKAGSQRFPRVIEPFYPDRGDFLAFVANVASTGLLRRTVGLFREHAAIPSYGLAAPMMLVPDIRRSDHAMFWPHGFPAVMITDTAGFRNPHYHRHSDRPDTLDYDRLALAVEGLAATFAGLATLD